MDFSSRTALLDLELHHAILQIVCGNDMESANLLAQESLGCLLPGLILLYLDLSRELSGLRPEALPEDRRNILHVGGVRSLGPPNRV
jgi:hypothetical protein